MIVNPASRNPYEHAELFCMLERLRRTNDLDSKADNELGELLMSVTKYSYSCYLKGRRKMKDMPDEAESDMLMYIIEVSRKADTSDPKKFVNCLIKSGQNKLRTILRDSIKHNKVISLGTTLCAVERSCSIDGTPHMNVFEELKLYKEAPDGEKDI